MFDSNRSPEYTPTPASCPPSSPLLPQALSQQPMGFVTLPLSITLSLSVFLSIYSTLSGILGSSDHPLSLPTLSSPQHPLSSSSGYDIMSGCCGQPDNRDMTSLRRAVLKLPLPLFHYFSPSLILLFPLSSGRRTALLPPEGTWRPNIYALGVSSIQALQSQQTDFSQGLCTLLMF